MKFYLIIYIVLLLVTDEISAATQKWIIVMISEDHLVKDTWVKHLKPKSRVYCATLCSLFPKCGIWCQKGHEECILHSLYVAPKYKEVATNIIKCYTRNRRDLAIESTSIESSLANSNSKSEFANDGIFIPGVSPYFRTQKENGAWAIFELEKSAKISEVRIGVDVINAPLLCNIYQVLIEETRSNMFIFNTDSCKYERNVMNYKVNEPKKGKSIMVSRPENNERLWFFFIEIDGEYE